MGKLCDSITLYSNRLGKFKSKCGQPVCLKFEAVNLQLQKIMADSLSSRRKRKLVTEANVINVSDDEVIESSQDDSDVEIIEKNAKIRHVDLSDLKNSNLQTVLQTSAGLKNHNTEVEIVSEELDVSSSQDLYSSQDVVCLGSNLLNGSLQEDSDYEIIGPRKKVESTQLVSQTSSLLQSQDSNSNTDFSVPNSEVDSGCSKCSSIKQTLLLLQQDVQQLKAENERLQSKHSTCYNLSNEVKPATDGLIATITFRTIEDYNTYNHEFLTAFESALKFNFSKNESTLTIEILKDDVDLTDWVLIDDAQSTPEKSKKKHKKKKKKRDKSSDDFFVLDATPNYPTKSNLEYQSKFNALLSKDGEETEKHFKNPSASACFNCNENHTLRDCPRPKNFNKINAARQKFKGAQNKTLRYHLEDDQKFSHLKPGVISEKLRQALGLREYQLPLHVYKMRQLGYPPGWFAELNTNQGSSLLLFDFEGKNDFKQKVDSDIDPEKIVEYSGFNVPLEKGVKDDYRINGCPRYSKEWSKDNMLEYARNLAQKAKDNLESCDIHVDQLATPKTTHNIRPRILSPTLNELETAKEKLLSQLIDANDDSISNSTLTQDENSDINEASFKTIDITGTVDDMNVSTAESLPGSPLPNAVKNTRFGTPILTSLSPYFKLPRQENFQQNVSDVINFENLPNSTGKYEQMVGVLDKVRTQMKLINSS